ncbi:MAG: hypothetical protein K8F27_10055 [Sulfuricellaceae bacterium]|nr:hypothetical protein [Sulfuricellaceae bacterium]
MGILDDLKKEADELKIRQETDTQNRLERITRNFVLVEDKLKQMHHFLLELVNQLNVIKPHVLRSYYLSGFGQIDNLLQEDYRLNTENFTIDNRDFIKEIHLAFKCKTDNPLTIDKETPALIEQFQDYLWRNNLKFEASEFRNARGYAEKTNFKLESSIPVNFVVSANFDQAIIKISSRNFAMIGQNEFTYDAEEITEALLDEFAKFLLDKPNKFRLMGRYQEESKVPAPTTEMEVNYVVQEGNETAPDEAKGPKLMGAIRSLFKKA